MKWLNITGLILQFTAFWFAAPELLGPETLKRFEKGLIGFVSKLPSYLLGGIGVMTGLAMGIYGARQGLAATRGQGESIWSTMIFILVVSVVVLGYFLFFARKTQQWMTRSIATPLVEKLISNNQSRKAALVTGAVFFTLGFLCQVIASAFT